jgi:hypothetical protein
MIQEHITEPSKVLAWLKKCGQTCQTPDREIAQEIAEGYDLLYQVAAQNLPPEALSTEARAQVVVGQSKIRNGFLRVLDVKTNRELLETAYREVAGPGTLEDTADPEVAERFQRNVDRLKAKPETSATGWYLQALATPVSSDHFLPAIEAYKNCLAVDAKDKECRTNYDELVAFYQRPRCKESDFSPHLQVMGAKVEESTGYQVKSNWEGHPWFIGKHPVVETSDLLEATLDTSPERSEIVLVLKTFSVPKLSRFMEAEQSSPEDTRADFFSIIDQSQILTIASVQANLPEGQFKLQFKGVAQAKTAFTQLCQKPTAEILPSNLRL